MTELLTVLASFLTIETCDEVISELVAEGGTHFVNLLPQLLSFNSPDNDLRVQLQSLYVR